MTEERKRKHTTLPQARRELPEARAQQTEKRTYEGSWVHLSFCTGPRTGLFAATIWARLVGRPRVAALHIVVERAATRIFVDTVEDIHVALIVRVGVGVKCQFFVADKS